MTREAPTPEYMYARAGTARAMRVRVGCEEAVHVAWSLKFAPMYDTICMRSRNLTFVIVFGVTDLQYEYY